MQDQPNNQTTDGDYATVVTIDPEGTTVKLLSFHFPTNAVAAMLSGGKIDREDGYTVGLAPTREYYQGGFSRIER